MVETGFVACGFVMGITIGTTLYLNNTNEFAKGEDRRVESEYMEICEKYERITAPAGVAAFKKSMVNMFEDAKGRAKNDGWLIYPGMRSRMADNWQKLIDYLDPISADDADAYRKIKDVFRANGQWNG